MAYTWSIRRQMSVEFQRFPVNLQEKIAKFILLYQQVGLSDFSLYEGKISPSWGGLTPHHENYLFAKKYNLWHYHLGFPSFNQRHQKYKTSDWVLHFQWDKERSPKHIDIVDVCFHYKSNLEFYLPGPRYLDLQ
jgi:hypothetical protein